MAMRTIKPQKADESTTWEEKSGLLRFLSTVNEEVTRFDATFDFGVRILTRQPESIDGSSDLLKNVGFVIVRHNRRLTGRDYCLYSVLRGQVLCGYIGVYSEGAIQTVRELSHMTDFLKASTSLLGWLKDLIKTSCDKI